jgi:curli biogenesis system outer membrane secretion channel CsgG
MFQSFQRVVSMAVLVGAVGASLSACDKSPSTSGAASGPSSVAPMAPLPDVGKLEVVKVNAEGFGNSASGAVAEAMRMALLQVNGAAIDSTTISAKFGLDVVTNESSESLRAQGFAETVRTRSGGVIQNLRIVDLSEPRGSAGKYKAQIEAGIAKFTASALTSKIKLAIAPLRFDRTTITVGDHGVPAAEVGAELRQRIQDALVNTGRFAVLDREFSPEIQQELDMIAGGEAPKLEVAKLGQAVTADLVWFGTINNLAYNKHVRQLRSSDRELVSYSGGWLISQKLVTVATRQVMTSDTLKGEAPSTEPSTLGIGTPSAKILGDMTDDLVRKVVASIMNRTFPISVVSLEGGNAILSQGGNAVQQGSRYALVLMGNELKDPQTGQTLGRSEQPCCEVVIDRVTPSLSYGHIEGANMSLEHVAPGALQVREQLMGKTGKLVGGAAGLNHEASGEETVQKSAHRQAKPDRPVGAPAGVGDKKTSNDDKW